MRLSLRKAISDIGLDLILARLGCILAVPASIYIYLSFTPRYLPIGVIIFVSCLLYLLIRKYKPPSVSLAVCASPRIYRGLNTLFFSLLAYSIAVYFFRPELYVRPMGYFVATAAMVAVLAVEILLLPQGKRYAGFVLSKAIMVGFSLVWTQSLLYPDLLGVDPWYHSWFTTTFVETGAIPSGTHYSMLPGMHSIIGGTMIATGLDYKMAALCSVSLVQVVCNPVFVFLIGKHIYNDKVGLLGALMLSVANNHVLFNYWIIPNGLALAFVPAIVYILMRLGSGMKLAWKIAVGLLVAAVVFTHLIATLMLALILILVWVGCHIYRRMYAETAVGQRAFFISAVITLVAGLGYSIIASGHIGTIADLVRSGFTPDYFQPLIVQGAPLGEQVFNHLGLFLFCAMGFVGAIAAFHKNTINVRGFAFCLAALAVLLFTGLSFVFQRYIILSRWCYLVQILLAVPYGVVLVWLGGLLKRRILNVCVVGLLVFALAFLLVVSPQANMDNRTFAPNIIFRSAFTQHELNAINDVAGEWEGQIAVDMQYYAMRWFYDGRLFDMSGQLISGNFSTCRGMLVLVRSSILTEPCKIDGYGVMRLDYDVREALKRQGFIEVYSADGVYGYVDADVAGVWYGT